MINWETEWPLIQRSALDHGVDPYFIAAIRHTENGGLGREFGVLSEKANLYVDQLNDACASVRNRIVAFPSQLYILNEDLGSKRLCYTSGFIKHFADRWAPPNVTNDPTNLNKNWFTNTLAAYTKFCEEGKPS